MLTMLKPSMPTIQSRESSEEDGFMDSNNETIEYQYTIE